MKPGEVSHYSGIYEQIDDLRDLNAEEWRAIPRLSFLAFDGGLDGDLRERALSTVATLDAYNGLIVLVAKQIASSAEQLEGRLSTEMLEYVRDTFDSQRSLRGNCVDGIATVAMLKPLMRK